MTEEKGVLDFIKESPDYVGSEETSTNNDTVDQQPSETDQEETEETPIEDGSEETDDAVDQQPSEDDVSKLEAKKVKVKIGDSEEEVTLEELKASYMRSVDYTKKTQELSEQRKALEAQTAVRNQELDRIRTTFSELEKSVFADLQHSEARSLREALMKVDVKTLNESEMAEFNRAELTCQQMERQERDKIMKYEAAAKKIRDEETKVLDEQYAQDQRALEKEIPEYADPVKREKLNQKISSFMLSTYGEKQAREIAPTIRSKEDYKTLYYAAVGKEFLETKTPAKILPKAKVLTGTNQAGSQTVQSPPAEKDRETLKKRITANGARREASDDDLIKLLMR